MNNQFSFCNGITRILFSTLMVTQPLPFVNNIFFTKVLKYKTYMILYFWVYIMATENGQSNFLRGTMAMIILSLLDGEDMYGYQLVQETTFSSGGRISTQEGSLYPVLYKLADQGYISDYKKLVGKRMTRVYYHLEPKGREYLLQMIQEYESTTEGIFQIIRGGKNEKK